MNDPHAAPSLVLYLHGFRSGPRSAKAGRLERWLRENRPDIPWWCPQLPASPRQAMELVEEGLRARPTTRLAVVGSSLGGYYATHVTERRGCRSVVLNPAVDPARDLAAYLGEQSAFHDPGVRFRFEAAYLDELRALACAPRLTQARHCLAVIAKGDELLDWREMSARYEGSQRILIDGGDHALSDFDAILDQVVAFLGLRASGPTGQAT